jgi:hypothetical protein
MVILLYPEYKVNIFSVDKPIKESNNYYAHFTGAEVEYFDA